MQLQVFRRKQLGIAAQRLAHAAAFLNHHHASRAARQRLEAERTATGEQVETALAAEVLPQPVEQCFAYAVGARAQTRMVGKTDAAAAPGAADDANLITFRHFRRRRSPDCPAARAARTRREPGPR